MTARHAAAGAVTADDGEAGRRSVASASLLLDDALQSNGWPRRRRKRATSNDVQLRPNYRGPFMRFMAPIRSKVSY